MLTLAKFVLGDRRCTMLKQQFISCKLTANLSLIDRRQILRIVMSKKHTF